MIVSIRLLEVLQKIIKAMACQVQLSERIEIAAQSIIIDRFQSENQNVSVGYQPTLDKQLSLVFNREGLFTVNHVAPSDS